MVKEIVALRVLPMAETVIRARAVPGVTLGAMVQESTNDPVASATPAPWVVPGLWVDPSG